MSMGFELSGLGEIALRQGDYARATPAYGRKSQLRMQLGNKWGIGVSLGMLGLVSMRQEIWNRAISQLGESLEIRQEIGDKGGSAWCLEHLADVARAQEQAEKAVRLLSAARQSPVSPLARSLISQIKLITKTDVPLCAVELGEGTICENVEEGRVPTLEQAIVRA